MSLLTSHSSANRIVDSGLVVTYSKALVSGNWSYTSANVSGWYNYMMEYHRRARMSLRYVGMTEAAAKDCKDAMMSAFTRSFKSSIWDGTTMGGSWSDSSAGEVPMADVAMVHNDDGSYDVVVNVNEDDTRMRKVGESASYATLFSSERSRSYDGEYEVQPSS